MTSKPTLTVRTGMIATALGAASALLIGMTLSAISSPRDFKPRLASLQEQARTAKDLLGASPKDSSLAPGVVCRGKAAAEAETLRAELAKLGAEAGLKVETLDARPDVDDGNLTRLEPIRVRFTATGPYEGVVSLLGALSRLKPSLFTDTLDLTAKTSNVSISFSGRAFCSA